MLFSFYTTSYLSLVANVCFFFNLQFTCFAFWLVKITNLLSKQNISFPSNVDWKKKTFVSELHHLCNSHLLNGDPPLFMLNKYLYIISLFQGKKETPTLKCVRQNSYQDLWSYTLYIIWQRVHPLVEWQTGGTDK